MLKALSEVAPTSVIIAIILWAGIAYFITAPEYPPVLHRLILS